MVLGPEDTKFVDALLVAWTGVRHYKLERVLMRDLVLRILAIVARGSKRSDILVNPSQNWSHRMILISNRTTQVLPYFFIWLLIVSLMLLALNFVPF